MIEFEELAREVIPIHTSLIIDWWYIKRKHIYIYVIMILISQIYGVLRRTFQLLVLSHFLIANNQINIWEGCGTSASTSQSQKFKLYQKQEAFLHMCPPRDSLEGSKTKRIQATPYPHHTFVHKSYNSHRLILLYWFALIQQVLKFLSTCIFPQFCSLAGRAASIEYIFCSNQKAPRGRMACHLYLVRVVQRVPVSVISL